MAGTKFAKLFDVTLQRNFQAFGSTVQPVWFRKSWQVLWNLNDHNQHHHLDPHQDRASTYSSGDPITSFSFGHSGVLTLSAATKGSAGKMLFQEDGDALIMAGKFQSEFLHGVPKREIWESLCDGPMFAGMQEWEKQGMRREVRCGDGTVGPHLFCPGSKTWGLTGFDDGLRAYLFASGNDAALQRLAYHGLEKFDLYSARCGPGTGLDLWVAVLEQLDDLEVRGLLAPEDLRLLRQMCLKKDSRLAILHQRYCKQYPINYQLFASRLLELLDMGPMAPEMKPCKSSSTQGLHNLLSRRRGAPLAASLAATAQICLGAAPERCPSRDLSPVDETKVMAWRPKSRRTKRSPKGVPTRAAATNPKTPRPAWSSASWTSFLEATLCDGQICPVAMSITPQIFPSRALAPTPSVGLWPPRRETKVGDDSAPCLFALAGEEEIMLRLECPLCPNRRGQMPSSMPAFGWEGNQPTKFWPICVTMGPWF
eukprot:s2413_g21.t2